MRTQFVIVLLALYVSIAHAADPLDNWGQWRGPLADGTAPRGNPPVEWSKDKNIKWKTPLASKGSATPIVWGDQVFVPVVIDTGRAADANSLPKPNPQFEKKTKTPTTYHQFVLVSFDRNSGKERWRQIATERVPNEGIQPTHSYAASSPVTDGKRLFVSFGSQGIYCYDLDGKLLWSRDLGRMNTRFGWGEGASPALHGDTLVMPWDQEAGSFVVALDAATGKTKWKVDRDEPTTWTTPLIVDHKGRTQVILPGTNRIHSYDLATGEVIWHCAGLSINVIPCSVARDGIVYCMSNYRDAKAVAIPLDATGDATDKILWKYAQATPYVPSPVLVGDRLYFTQANLTQLTCLDIKTGKPVIDRERLPGLDSLYGSPVAAAGRIYITGRNGTTLVLKQSDKLEVLATNRLDDPIDASPAVVGRQLLLRGEKFLYCIEAP
jgi:outer membrane protein assembly factor BamB